MRWLILLLPLAACAPGHRGHDEAKALIAARCAACHRVPGVPQATGRVGPSLDGIARQQIIAGFFPHDRPTMTRWVANAQTMLPGNAMPDTGLTPAQAAKVTDYLETLE